MSAVIPAIAILIARFTATLDWADKEGGGRERAAVVAHAQRQEGAGAVDEGRAAGGQDERPHRRSHRVRHLGHGATPPRPPARG